MMKLIIFIIWIFINNSYCLGPSKAGVSNREAAYLKQKNSKDYYYLNGSITDAKVVKWISNSTGVLRYIPCTQEDKEQFKRKQKNTGITCIVVGVIFLPVIIGVIPLAVGVVIFLDNKKLIKGCECLDDNLDKILTVNPFNDICLDEYGKVK